MGTPVTGPTARVPAKTVAMVAARTRRAIASGNMFMRIPVRTKKGRDGDAVPAVSLGPWSPEDPGSRFSGLVTGASAPGARGSRRRRRPSGPIGLPGGRALADVVVHHAGGIGHARCHLGERRPVVTGLRRTPDVDVRARGTDPEVNPIRDVPVAMRELGRGREGAHLGDAEPGCVRAGNRGADLGVRDDRLEVDKGVAGPEPKHVDLDGAGDGIVHGRVLDVRDDQLPVAADRLLLDEEAERDGQVTGDAPDEATRAGLAEHADIADHEPVGGRDGRHVRRVEALEERVVQDTGVLIRKNLDADPLAELELAVRGLLDLDVAGWRAIRSDRDDRLAERRSR